MLRRGTARSWYRLSTLLSSNFQGQCTPQHLRAVYYKEHGSSSIGWSKGVECLDHGMQSHSQSRFMPWSFSFSTSTQLSQTPQGKEGHQQTDGSRTEAADPLWNWPNGISMARMLSGPFIAHLIVSQQWKPALLALGISGASDWLDGFVARRYNQGSVFGSYLDPLADKVLIGFTAGALAIEGSLPTLLAALIIGRDVFLVSGAFVLRLRTLEWQWPGWVEFFRTTASPQRASGDNDNSPDSSHQTLQDLSHRRLEQGVNKVGQHSTSSGGGHVDRSSRAEDSCRQKNPSKAERRVGDNGSESTNPESAPRLNETQETTKVFEGGQESTPAPFVTPLYVSKVNTVAQLGLIAGCITFSWYGSPSESVLMGLGGVTVLLTIGSGFEYYRKHRSRN